MESLFEQTIIACHSESDNISTDAHNISESYLLDETTLNPLLTKFAKENYKGIKSINAVSAKILKNDLKIECIIKLSSGKSKKTTITAENFDTTAGNKLFKCNLDNVFKVESSNRCVSPMILEANMRNYILSFSKIKYDFRTISEGKLLRICGNAVNE
jgi:hypothetical protein